MKCPKCGNEISEDVLNCPVCGQLLKEETETVLPENKISTQQVVAPKKRGRPRKKKQTEETVETKTEEPISEPVKTEEVKPETDDKPATRTCSVCGKEVPVDSGFCKYCGHDFTAALPITKQPEGKKCPGCGAMLDEDDMFCRHCGYNFTTVAPLVADADKKVCPECGTVLPASAIYCRNCGRKLTAEEKPAPKKQHKKKFPIMTLVLALVLVALLATGIWYFFLRGDKPEPVKPDETAQKEESLRKLEESLEVVFLKDSENRQYEAFEYGTAISDTVVSHNGETITVSPGKMEDLLPFGESTVVFKLTATDSYGQKAEKEISRTYKVIDSSKPYILLDCPILYLTPNSNLNPAANVTEAFDLVDGPLSYNTTLIPGSYTTESDIDFATPGTYKVTVKAMDLNGNRASASYEVQIDENNDLEPFNSELAGKLAESAKAATAAAEAIASHYPSETLEYEIKTYEYGGKTRYYYQFTYTGNTVRRAKAYPVITQIGTGTVITNNLRIRTGAGTDYDIVGQAENKKTYPVYEVRKVGKYTWYMIDYNQWISDQGGKWVTYTSNENEAA